MSDVTPINDDSNPQIKYYGPGLGEDYRDAMIGAMDQQLQPGDAALSPDLAKKWGLSLGDTFEHDGKTFRYADHSYISPDKPNTNTLEIWVPKGVDQKAIAQANQPQGSIGEALNPANFDLGDRPLQGLDIPDPLTTAQVPTDTGIPGVQTQDLSPIGEQSYHPSNIDWAHADVLRGGDGKPIVNSDGSLTLKDGNTKIFRDGHYEYKMGNKIFSQASPLDQPKDVTGGHSTSADEATEKEINTQTVRMGKDPRGMTDEQKRAILATKTPAPTVLTKEQQHEVDRVTSLASSSRSLYAKQYVAMQPNYVSVVENVTSKPMEKRSGVDDAYLISAAAGLENPGRSTTENDFTLLMKTQGIRGSAEVLAKRIKGALAGNADDQAYLAGTRVLSDAQVKQIMENANRAIKPRYDEYLSGQKAYENRLKKVGVDPEEYLPQLPLPEVPTTVAPQASPKIDNNVVYREAKRVQAESKDPEELRKADAVIASMRARGIIPNE